MPYQQPLIPFIKHCADPPDLPVRAAGDGGEHGEGVLERVVEAEVVGDDGARVTFKAATTGGRVLHADVRAAADGVIRVRLAQDAVTAGRSSAAIALTSDPGYDAARVECGDGVVRVHAGAITAEVTLKPWRMRFLDANGRLLVEQCGYETDVSNRLRILPFGNSSVDGQVIAWHESFAAPADEHFFGLGEKFTVLDKRGQRIVSWNFDAFSAESERAYKNVPMYLSSRGYGVLFAGGTATEFDLCHSTHSTVQVTVPDDLLDYYVIAGPAPEQMLDRYHRLTGRPVAPPKWALGAWISSGFLPDSQRRVLKRAAMIRDRGVPCDVLHIDAHWMPFGLWSDLRWDERRFPDPEGMLATLAELGLRVCVWIAPYLSHRSPVFAEAAEAGHLLRRSGGEVYVSDVWHGFHEPCGIVDFTSSAAIAWYQDRLRTLLRQGVGIFKTDFGEGVPTDAVAANGMRGDALHNVYPLLFNDAVADVTEEVHGHRVVWARSSFTGGQRHCAQWAGDTNATFPSMASTLRGGLSYALSGVPYWSHDVGGFTGQPGDELMIRSAQFGALSPLMRLHGQGSRLPWLFAPDVERAVLDAIRLRYRLMPYLYSACVEAAATGLPVIRPLLIEAPGEPAAYAADLEYLLGPDLLVAPMISPDGTRHVWLPPGDWIDYWTGVTVAGGRHVRVTRPLTEVPLFVRCGAVLPMVEPGDRVGDGPFPELVLACWGASGRALVHDVDGPTTVEFARHGDTATVTSGGPRRIGRAEFPAWDGGPRPERVRINGIWQDL